MVKITFLKKENDKYILELSEEEIEKLINCIWYIWQKLPNKKEELQKFAEKFHEATWGWNKLVNGSYLYKDESNPSDYLIKWFKKDEI